MVRRALCTAICRSFTAYMGGSRRQSHQPYDVWGRRLGFNVTQARLQQAQSVKKRFTAQGRLKRPVVAAKVNRPVCSSHLSVAIMLLRSSMIVLDCPGDAGADEPAEEDMPFREAVCSISAARCALGFCSHLPRVHQVRRMKPATYSPFKLGQV